MIGPLEFMLALFMDFAIGDPAWLPHPVRVIGKAVSSIERFLRRHFSTPAKEKQAGIILVTIIVALTFTITLLLLRAILSLPPNVFMFLGMLLIVYLTATTIAARELITAAKLVIASVKDRRIEEARQKLSMIVGRDTVSLSEEEILRATIETLAENLSDGIIAPIFYLTVGGLPAAFTYKAINTMDSMVGYKNERYRHFGWAAARLDDIANYVPARISGLMIVASVFIVALLINTRNAFLLTGRSWKIMLRDGKKHASPNSGVPEAAMAGALGVRLGGPSSYGGVISAKPFIGDHIIRDYLPASESALNIIRTSSLLAAGLAVIILFLRTWL